MEEKLFPISVNRNLCVRCQKCSYSCSPKAIFWRDSLRFVNYEKCQGCLKCVDVCEHGAIEVISLAEGKLVSFDIDKESCLLCKKCLEDGFCFENLFTLEIRPDGKEIIMFKPEGMKNCSQCLKCFKNCPNNAIIPKFVF